MKKHTKTNKKTADQKEIKNQKVTKKEAEIQDEYQIKPIPKEIKGKDTWIVLLKDLGDYALYLNKTEGYKCGFEVHKIRPRKEQIKKIKGKTIYMPTRNVIATTREFGFYAWFYPDLETVYKNYPIFKQYDTIIKDRAKKAMNSQPQRTED